LNFDLTLNELDRVNKHLDEVTTRRDALTEKLIAEFPQKYPIIYVQRETWEMELSPYTISSAIVGYYLTREEADRATPKNGASYNTTRMSWVWNSCSSTEVPRDVILRLILDHQTTMSKL
jgi:hypothetical protein